MKDFSRKTLWVFAAIDLIFVAANVWFIAAYGWDWLFAAITALWTVLLVREVRSLIRAAR